MILSLLESRRVRLDSVFLMEKAFEERDRYSAQVALEIESLSYGNRYRCCYDAVPGDFHYQMSMYFDYAVV
jgi:hypothetical protein